MTSLIEEIRQKIFDGQFEFSKHAVDQSILRQIQVQEVREVRRFLENKLPASFDFAQLACALSEVEGQNLKGRIFSGNHLISKGQVIEDYPNDKYGSSCLVSGLTQSQRPIHVQCSYPSRDLLKIITLYEPDRQRWNNDFTERRTQNAD